MPHSTPPQRAARISGRCGLSIVELLVGIAIGLFILAGASLVASQQIGDNRLLMLETQVQQDLRATADMVVRDIRRAGFWGNAALQVWPAATGVVANPYPSLAASAVGPRTNYEYTYSSADASTAENGLDDAERYGFAWNSSAGTVEMRLGAAGWQTLTDPAVLRVTKFDVTIVPSIIELPCSNPCAALLACPPTQTIRDVSVVIEGQAVHDEKVKRSIRSDVRLRNDEVTGSCPA